jgi:hypothetical protein
VSFEGLDGTFCKVATVNVRRYELIGGFPIFCDDSNAFGTGFIVEDLVINNVAACFQSRHETVVGWNAVTVIAGLEGFHENGVGIALIC